MKDQEFLVWKKLIQWRIQKLNLERNEMLKSIINHKTQMFGQSRSIYCTVTMLTLKYLMHWTDMVLAKHLKMLPSPKVAQNLVDNLIKQHSEQSTFFTMLFDQVGLPIMIKSTFFTMLFDQVVYQVLCYLGTWKHF